MIKFYLRQPRVTYIASKPSAKHCGIIKNIQGNNLFKKKISETNLEKIIEKFFKLYVRYQKCSILHNF